MKSNKKRDICSWWCETECKHDFTEHRWGTPHDRKSVQWIEITDAVNMVVKEGFNPLHPITVALNFPLNACFYYYLCTHYILKYLNNNDT